MSFNQNSQIPDHMQGHIETAVQTDHYGDNTQPSVAPTNRYNLPQWLLRKYTVEISKRGNPYFQPIESVLQACIRDADEALAEARAMFKSDVERGEIITSAGRSLRDYRDSLKAQFGEGFDWKVDMLTTWPISDQVGFQLYQATHRAIELDDYGLYLLRDARTAEVQSAEDLQRHEGFLKSQGWLEIAYKELGEMDALYTLVKDEADYNVPAIIRKGYQSAAQLDTRTHLSGVQGNAPMTEDAPSEDIRAAIRASRRMAS